MKKIIRLNESDLFKIVKRVLNEQENETPRLIKYKIKPIRMGADFVIYVWGDPISKKIYNSPEMYAEIGFKDEADLEANFLTENKKEYTRKFSDGLSYLRDISNASDDLDLARTLEPFLQIGGCNRFGFIWKTPYGDDLPTPHIIGLPMKMKKRNKQKYINSDVRCLTSGGRAVEDKGKDITTTTTTIPPVPEKIKLDLLNSFYYDCPSKPGCGTRGGSNRNPLTSQEAYTKIEEFAKIIKTYYKSSKPIYVLGFASIEGNSRHNLELSQFRANFVADMLNSIINDPSIKIIPIGRGATTAFKSGNTENDYIQNRRIIVTLNPDSIEPHIFVFTKK